MYFIYFSLGWNSETVSFSQALLEYKNTPLFTTIQKKYVETIIILVDNKRARYNSG